MKIKKKKLNFTNFDVVEKFDTLNSVKNSCNYISSFLTIQEGCDKFCKFCVVPYTRGAEYSRSLNEIVKECKNLVDNGSVEVTLLGQNVNAYNFNGKRISDLVYELSKINHLKRIRYTTSHPVDFTKDLVIAHSQIDKLMPLIHLPIQSGSNNILEKMNRKHSIEEYLEVINQLLEVNSLIKFSSDFIIGYPGETDRDFEETLKLLKKIKYINSYSYIFSPRPGTPSAKMKIIDNSVSKRRLTRFQKLADEIKLKYKRSLINKQSKVLFENKTKEKNEFFGRDEFNNSVIVKSDRNLIGKIEKVKILNGNQNSLFGEIYSDTENKVHAA